MAEHAMVAEVDAQHAEQAEPAISRTTPVQLKKYGNTASAATRCTPTKA
jgi:hypothetical protein